MTSTTASAPACYGRIVLAAVDHFTAECYEPDGAPPLGTPVVVGDGPAVLAVTANVLTESRDGTRPLAVRGGPDDDLARVHAEHPHVPALLHTVFDCAVVGHWDGVLLRQYLPSAPPPVLGRVRAATLDECADLAGSFEFLRLLMEAAAHPDDVIAAALRQLAAPRPDRRAFLVRAGKELTLLMADDPLRLHAVLRRIQP